MNISLLCKWWWKLEAEEGLWQQIVRQKYMSKDTVGSVKHMLDDSPMWKDLLKVKNVYMKVRTMIVKNGKATSFWLDTWIHNKPLCILYPVLFDLCLDKHISIHQFLARQGQLEFNRWLNPLLFEQWLSVIDTIYHHNFSATTDTHAWKWNKGRMFTTKSVYEYLTKDETVLHFKHI